MGVYFLTPSPASVARLLSPLKSAYVHTGIRHAEGKQFVSTHERNGQLLRKQTLELREEGARNVTPYKAKGRADKQVDKLKQINWTAMNAASRRRCSMHQFSELLSNVAAESVSNIRLRHQHSGNLWPIYYISPPPTAFHWHHEDCCTLHTQ